MKYKIHKDFTKYLQFGIEFPLAWAPLAGLEVTEIAQWKHLRQLIPSLGLQTTPASESHDHWLVGGSPPRTWEVACFA
jgi:hypothetical protein